MLHSDTVAGNTRQHPIHTHTHTTHRETDRQTDRHTRKKNKTTKHLREPADAPAKS